MKHKIIRRSIDWCLAEYDRIHMEELFEFINVKNKRCTCDMNTFLRTLYSNYQVNHLGYVSRGVMKKIGVVSHSGKTTDCHEYGMCTSSRYCKTECKECRPQHRATYNRYKKAFALVRVEKEVNE